MAKKVNIILRDDGSIGFAFEGFDGDSCYSEADKIREKLKSLGIEMSVIEIESKPFDDTPPVKISQTVKEKQ